MFIEKPIFESTKYNLDSILPDADSIYYVAAPIRFTDVIQNIKKLVSERPVYAVRSICSSYMPNWQKGRDYTKSFRTRFDDGGGVDIDSVHEIDYIVDIFGMPKGVHRTAGKYSNLKMDACDIASYIFEYDHFLVELHVDYFGRYENRQVEIYCDNDVIVGDLFQKEIIFRNSGKRIQFDKNTDHYYREMINYMELILTRNKSLNINPITTAFNVLKLAKGKL